MLNPQLWKIHLKEMKSQLLSLFKVKGKGKILGDSSFRRIPSVSKFEIINSAHNPILQSMGIKVRMNRKARITKISNQEKMNRYMSHTILRIRKLVKAGEMSKAWKIAWLNIKYSNAFRISAINYVCKGWYFNTSQSEVWKICRTVHKILMQAQTKIDFKRVYILKANGKYRPLGVPTVAWRVVLHLINGFIFELLGNKLLSNQHGYVPNKGMLTAWREIIENLNSKYIYETDLKGFFDNVSIWKILDVMQESNAPSEIKDYFMEMASSIPKFPKEEKLDEARFKFEKVNSGLMRPSIRKIQVEKEFIEPDFWDPLLSLINKSDSIESVPISENVVLSSIEDSSWIYHYSKMKSKSLTYLEKLNYGLTPGGVPQGVPLSPLLSILALPKYLQQSKSVNYADDQIFFSEAEMHIKADNEIGLIHSEEKCKWIKRNGSWIEDSMKFLGLKISKNWELSSETRNGSTGKIPKIVKILYSNESIKKLELIVNQRSLKSYIDWLKSYQVKDLDKQSTINITKRNIFGFICSSLQNDDWNNNNLVVNREKALLRFEKELHKNAFVAKEAFNNKIISSQVIPFLKKIIETTTRDSNRKYKNVLKQSARFV